MNRCARMPAFQRDGLGHTAVGEGEEHVFGYAKGAQIVDPDPGQFALVAGGRIVVGVALGHLAEGSCSLSVWTELCSDLCRLRPGGDEDARQQAIVLALQRR